MNVLTGYRTVETVNRKKQDQESRKETEKSTKKMSSQLDTGATNVTVVGARAAAVKNLKVLKTPEEGGTKKDYDDVLRRSTTM